MCECVGGCVVVLVSVDVCMCVCPYLDIANEIEGVGHVGEGVRVFV